MALFANYDIKNESVYLVVTVRWKLTAGGAVIHQDQWRYDLTAQSVIRDGADGLAERITNDVRQRALVINRGVQIFQAVPSRLGAPQNTDVQVK